MNICLRRVRIHSAKGYPTIFYKYPNLTKTLQNPILRLIPLVQLIKNRSSNKKFENIIDLIVDSTQKMGVDEKE